MSSCCPPLAHCIANWSGRDCRRHRSLLLQLDCSHSRPALGFCVVLLILSLRLPSKAYSFSADVTRAFWVSPQEGHVPSQPYLLKQCILVNISRKWNKRMNYVGIIVTHGTESSGTIPRKERQPEKHLRSLNQFQTFRQPHWTALSRPQAFFRAWPDYWGLLKWGFI